jgi:putative membrane protein
MQTQTNTKGSDILAENVENVKTQHFSITHFIVRLIVSAIVLGVTAALVPGFAISGIWTLLIAAAVIALLDYLAQRVLGVDATPFGRGISGFIVAAVIIYLTKFIVPGYSVTLIGAVLGALVYGLVDLIIPGKAM